VVGAIAPKLEQAEIERTKRKPTDSLDAYDFYLRGLATVNQVSREATDTALRMFATAAERDPDFTLAYAHAAWCYTSRKTNGWMENPAQEIAEAERLAKRAVQLGRDDAAALCFGGITLGYVVGHVEDGAAFVDRALALNPNLAVAWLASAWLKLCRGEVENAISNFNRGIRLSPLDSTRYAWQTDLALAHFFAGRYGEAVRCAEEAFGSFRKRHPRKPNSPREPLRPSEPSGAEGAYRQPIVSCPCSDVPKTCYLKSCL
jgi:tetratricopeptide (TPR) repeat protein